MAGIERSHHSVANGMIKNQNKLSQKQDSYSYALNGIKSNPITNSSQIENEKGFLDIIDIGTPFILLGQIWFGEKKYVIFVKNLDTSTTLFSRIYYVDLDTANHTLVYPDPTLNQNLNFKSTNEIKGTYKINYLNQRIIYWVDGVSTDRNLNIDLSPLTVPLEQLALSAEFAAANIYSQTSKDNGGVLQTGTYEFALRYRFQNYSVTNIFGLNLPVDITLPAEYVVQADYGRFNGSKSGVLTSKSISLVINDLDPLYTAFDLIVVRTVNGVAIVTAVENIQITAGSTSRTYVYTGLEQATPINEGITAVTVDPITYYGTEVIGQSENRLLRANLKQDTIVLRYQQYANNIVVKYNTVATLVQDGTLPTYPATLATQNTSYTFCSFNPKVTEYTMNLMRGEVYSLGVSFILNSGLETQVYHIPGRVALSADTTLVTDLVNGGQSPSWKVADNSPYDSTTASSYFSYWESTEIYPTGFDFPTGVIRHHKIPKADVLPISMVDTNTNKQYVYYIKLQFTNIQIPPEIKSQIKLIKFQMTPRDLDINKSIVAKGAFIRTAISGASTEYTGNPKQTIPNVNPRYIVAASPFSTIPKDYNLVTNGDLSVLNQQTATYANVKLNLNHYGKYSSGNGHDMEDMSNICLPSPNVSYVTTSSGSVTGSTPVSTEQYKSFLFFHSPDTDPKADNNFTPALSASQIYIEARMQGNVNWFMNTSQIQDIPIAGSNACHVYNQPFIDFKGQCIFNNIDNRSGKKNAYKVKGAAYVPYDSRLSESTLGTLSMPYFGQLREGGTLIELDPNSLNQLDVSDYGTESSTTFTPNVNQPIYNTGDNNNGVGYGSPYGPYGTQDWHARFTSWIPPVGSPTPSTSYVPNTAVYYYGSINSQNDGQYGRVLGLNYRYLGITVDDLTTDSNNMLISPITGIAGDTYIDMYSVKRTTYTNYYNDAASRAGVLFQIYMAGISSFPVESTINPQMRLSGSSDGQAYYPKDIYGTTPDSWMDKNFYFDNYLKINLDYLKQYSKQNFGPIQVNQIPTGTGLVSKSTQIYQTRIAYSEKALSEDTQDYWKTYLANNYRDLPKNRGFISGMFTKAEQIFVLTRDSLFDVYGSNSSIQTTTTQNIAVGTGTFFGIEPKEMLTIDGGFAGTSSKCSIVETPYGYLFVDKNKKKIILFSDKMIDISMMGVGDFWKERGGLSLHDQIPDLKKQSGFDNPLNNIGYVGGYDPDHLRILITKLDYNLVDMTRYKGVFNSGTTYGATDIYTLNGALTNNANNLSFSDSSTFENKGFTMSYLPQLEQWVSDHSYLPNNYLPHPTGFMAKINASPIQISNKGNFGQYFNASPSPFILEIVSNTNPIETKVLDSIKINVTGSQDFTGYSTSKNTFFDNFYVYNEFQNSGAINLVLNYNLTKKEKDWSINKFFDIVSSNHNTSLFSTTWANTQLQYPIDKVINTAALDTTKPWYTQGRFRDKYFIIRFSKNNLQNDKIIVNFVSSIYRKSIR